MRNKFVSFLEKKIDAGVADDVVLITGDLGFSVLEPLREKLGRRFLNAGIAEALMSSMAAGIAADGLRVFTYSITPFATFRCLEQIRNDICYHNLDVTVVGIGAGFGYGPLGPTHHSLEDLACMWSLPNMHVFCPADETEAEHVFESAWNLRTPKYLRLGKGGEGRLKGSSPNVKMGAVNEYRAGTELTIISTGHILAEVLRATEALDGRVQVLSCPFLKPLPGPDILSLITSPRVLVADEMNPYGGFGAQLAKVALSGQSRASWQFISAPDNFAKVVGSTQFLRQKAGLDAQSIETLARKLIS